MDASTEIDFRTCPNCNGYGVRDNGKNCVTCGGVGSGGLHSTDGRIGSGEIMIDKKTGRQVTLKEFTDFHAPPVPREKLEEMLPFTAKFHPEKLKR